MTKTLQQASSHATKFACHAPAARAVFVAGVFNDWDPQATPMEKDANGNWGKSLNLPLGRHEFKFVVDGEWCCELGCHESVECSKCVPNDFGTMNRVIDVA